MSAFSPEPLPPLPLPPPPTTVYHFRHAERDQRREHDSLTLVHSINSIEKSRLSAESFSYSGSEVAWKARLVLFMGFALMAGGLAGSVTVMVLKYVVPQYPFPTLYFGVANVVGNALIMLR